MRPMGGQAYTFDRYRLDPVERVLSAEGRPVELANRYFDALVLLVRDSGTLVSKDRFHDEVWRGVPVTDEALTQCIRTLRKVLGDDASAPRFIETVPKHGYRFVARVEQARAGDSSEADLPAIADQAAGHRITGWNEVAVEAGSGTVGAAICGVIGGLFYGTTAASNPASAASAGSLSIVLVLTAVTALVAAVGGAGVVIGIVATRSAISRSWLSSTLGGALGGLMIGAVGKMLGLDAFRLLLGRTPGDITGAPEGLVLGGAVGFATWFAGDLAGNRRKLAATAFIGGAAGMGIVLMGGRMMGGSLHLLSRGFPGSRLRLDELGAPFGDPSFGVLAQAVTGMFEGALFALCIVGGMALGRRIFGAGENPAPTLREA